MQTPMQNRTIALFGEAEKGEFRTPYFCKSLPQLVDNLGHPPASTLGLFFAIQALMYQHPLIFFRVKEEGFSLSDYLSGVQILQNRELANELIAVCTPGLGNGEVMQALLNLCKYYHSILIMTESDLYDYLTESTSTL